MPGRAHRRLDCRSATGGALAAGARGCCPSSSRRSPATTATSWTIWSKKSCSVSPTLSAAFLLQTAILDRLSGPLCDAVTGQEGAARGWKPWSAATSLSCRWMTNATGIAITTSLPTCSLRICGRSSPIRSRPASAGERVVRAERFARRCDPPRAGRRGFRARGGAGRAWPYRPCAGVDRRPRRLGWLKALPDELVRARPVLSVAYAWALLA
jgi:LuxR family maltose regulon positive regulatory protein